MPSTFSQHCAYFTLLIYSSKLLITVNAVLTICKGRKYLDEQLLPWTAKHANRKQVNSGPLRFKSSCCIISNYYIEQFTCFSKFNNYVTESLHRQAEMKLCNLTRGFIFSNMLQLWRLLKEFLWYAWVPHDPKKLKFQMLGSLTFLTELCVQYQPMTNVHF